MYEALLKDAIRWSKKWGDQLQPPASEADLLALAEQARAEFGFSVPPEYEAFLRLHDGFEFNGCMIYGSVTRPITGYTDRSIQGFVESNEIWREAEVNRDYLYFGDGDISMYGCHLPSGEYRVMDRQSDTVIKVVPSFDALIAAALQAHRFTED
jgi:cell wall assembly regulator SMI1